MFIVRTTIIIMLTEEILKFGNFHNINSLICLKWMFLIIFIVLKMPGNCYWKFMWFLESGRQRKCLKQLRSVCRTKIQRFNSLLWRYVPSWLNLDTSSIEIWYISGNCSLSWAVSSSRMNKFKQSAKGNVFI